MIMIFRWSMWGETISKNIELLSYSIRTFQKQFGKDHQYIIYSDDASFVLKSLTIAGVDIRPFPSESRSPFCVLSKATWLKWCPSSRLDINQDEFYIDADVFLVKDPEEIHAFLSNPKMKFAIMDEFCGQSWQHGAMRRRATPDTPFVNAGLFVQKAGQDISDDLRREFNWWQRNIAFQEQTHHDEQGALAIALTRYLMDGELLILPKEQYAIISETSNVGRENLDRVTLFHATYPTHPAFYRFKSALDEVLGS